MKPWWQSRIIIAAAVSGILQLFKAFGVEIPCVEENLVNAIIDLTTVASSIYIIYKRQDGQQATIVKELPK